MKPTKLAWLITLVLGTCTGTAVVAQPAPIGSDSGSAALGSADPAPTPVPVEDPNPTPPAPTPPAPTPVPTTTVDSTPGSAPPAALEKHEPGKPGEAGEAGEEEHEANVDNSAFINWGSIHYGDKDYYGGKLGDGNMDFKDVHNKDVHETTDEEKMSPPFVFMLINFALFLFVLAKYMRPAGHKLAAERHDLIKNALDEAAKLRKQAEDKLAEYEAKLAKADSEIKTMVEGMRADAEADKARMLAAADKAAAQLKRDAEVRIAAEIESARARLTREVTVAAAAATEKILRDKTTADDQNKLVGSFIADMANVPQKGARP